MNVIAAILPAMQVKRPQVSYHHKIVVELGKIWFRFVYGTFCKPM